MTKGQGLSAPAPAIGRAEVYGRFPMTLASRACLWCVVLSVCVWYGGRAGAAGADAVTTNVAAASDAATASPPRVCVVQIMAGGEVVSVFADHPTDPGMAILVPPETATNVPVSCQTLTSLGLAVANQEAAPVSLQITVFTHQGTPLCSRGPFTLSEQGARGIVFGSDCVEGKVIKVLGFATGDSSANFHLKHALASEFQLTEISASAISTVKFDEFDIIYVTDDAYNSGTPAYAVNLNARQADIAQFLSKGGGLVFGVQTFRGDTTNGDEYNFLPPGLVDGQPTGMMVYGNKVRMTDPSHPIFAGVSNADLSNWGYSYHGFFATGSLLTVAIETDPYAGPSDESVIRVGSYGAGTIVGWTLHPDYHQRGMALVRNALHFAAGQPPASAQEALQLQRDPHARPLVP
jgi:hypothetical protein